MNDTPTFCCREGDIPTQVLCISPPYPTHLVGRNDSPCCSETDHPSISTNFHPILWSSPPAMAAPHGGDPRGDPWRPPWRPLREALRFNVYDHAGLLLDCPAVTTGELLEMIAPFKEPPRFRGSISSHVDRCGSISSLIVRSSKTFRLKGWHISSSTILAVSILSMAASLCERQLVPL